MASLPFLLVDARTPQSPHDLPLKWGFVNAKGEEVFSPQFDDVESFQEKGMTLGFIGEEPFILFENGKKAPLSQFAEFVNDITTKK